MKSRTRYVYFDKKTGFITHILPTRRRGRAKYIECDISEVIGFLDGSKGVNRYVVAYNTETKQNSLIEKNNIILFRKQSKNLYKIPYRRNIETDLRLVYYSDNVLEASLDMSRISPLYQTNFRDEVYFERGTEIRIIIKEKGKDSLLKEIQIDAQELLDSGQMFFKLYDHMSADNVEFFTYKLFNTYSWAFGKNKLISPLTEKIKFEVHKADSKRRSKNFEYHLIVNVTEDGLKIKNNIEKPKLIRFSRNIEFFIVDKHDPNILYEKFYIDKYDIDEKEITIKLNTDAAGKTILYNNKYISVLKEN